MITGLMIGFLYGIMALGLSLIFGTLRVINMAHGHMIVLGMYFAYWLWKLYNINPLISGLICIPLFFVFGCAWQKILVEPLRKLRLAEIELYTIMATYGFSIIIENLLINYWTTDIRFISIPYLYLPIDLKVFKISVIKCFTIITCILLYISVYMILKKTYIGMAIRAFIQNREALASIGFNINQIPLIGAGIGTALCGISGAIISLNNPFYPTLGGALLNISFTIVVFGGMGSIEGAIVGGIIIGILEGLVTSYVSITAATLGIYLLFILLLLFRPEGLFGERV